MSLKNLKVSRRKVCIGDLRHLVTIHDRRLGEPAFGATEFTEEFDSGRKVWAAIKTVVGKTLFNAVAGDREVTHELRLRADPNVTSENWIELDDGTLLDILSTEDLDERGEWLVLLCAETGARSQPAARA